MKHLAKSVPKVQQTNLKLVLRLTIKTEFIEQNSYESLHRSAIPQTKTLHVIILGPKDESMLLQMTGIVGLPMEQAVLLTYLAKGYHLRLDLF